MRTNLDKARPLQGHGGNGQSSHLALNQDHYLAALRQAALEYADAVRWPGDNLTEHLLNRAIAEGRLYAAVRAAAACLTERRSR